VTVGKIFADFFSIADDIGLVKIRRKGLFSFENEFGWWLNFVEIERLGKSLFGY